MLEKEDGSYLMGKNFRIPKVNKRDLKSSKEGLQDSIQFFPPIASQSNFAIISSLHRHL